MCSIVLSVEYIISMYICPTEGVLLKTSQAARIGEHLATDQWFPGSRPLTLVLPRSPLQLNPAAKEPAKKAFETGKTHCKNVWLTLAFAEPDRILGQVGLRVDVR